MDDCDQSLPWPGFSGATSNGSSSFMEPWPIEPHFTASSSVQCHGFPPLTTTDKATTISKSHSEAEKQRRDRINAQLTGLRKLIPKSNKMDKAALLGNAIEQVKDLKMKATEISKAFTIPTESDEVTIDCNVSEDKMFIRASVCCDDRPEVFAELIRVLKELRLSIVDVEITSIGGRIKNELIVRDNKSDKEGVEDSMSTLKQSLNVVVNRINALSSDASKSNWRIRSKRQRLFLPSHFPQ
ncbi:Differentiation-associated protein 1, putative isoform 1 [Hibiscus syriacus]|uniref:Differentiation-associated protein 1, putative isoform 1 n=1 Tax=Hibiscus syriacus TaxID=106335 RepID=A0A6A2X3U0_HIBSY|nr:transcription factor bHLH51-like [Hibiscus syriacus]KAE8669368.1 Differentiation-associated protein 1, putative isoform 1 [Hibiscus syriacus]